MWREREREREKERERERERGRERRRMRYLPLRNHPLRDLFSFPPIQFDAPSMVKKNLCDLMIASLLEKFPLVDVCPTCLAD